MYTIGHWIDRLYCTDPLTEIPERSDIFRHSYQRNAGFKKRMAAERPAREALFREATEKGWKDNKVQAEFKRRKLMVGCGMIPQWRAYYKWKEKEVTDARD